MKIGIYDPYLDDLGGGEKYMMTIAECLSRDNDVNIFWDDKKDLEKLLERFSLDLSRIKIVKNIFSLETSFLKRVLTTRLYNAIIVLSDGSIPFTLSKKLFIHFQAPMEHIRVDNWKTRLKISRVAKFFCNAHFTKDYVDKEFEVNSLVLYPPITAQVKKVKKENVILHVGRFRARNVDINCLVDYKKQGVLIETFKKMVDSGLQNWHFVLAVGVQEEDYPKFEKLKEVVLGYPIKFLVNMTSGKLWDLYSRAKIYWHASGFGEDLQKHPERAEHFGISTVEAMSAGCVPVVINAGGQKEIVRDGENGLFWNTLQELQDKTLWVIRDVTTWQRLSESAKRVSKTYSKERFCRELDGIIEG